MGSCKTCPCTPCIVRTASHCKHPLPMLTVRCHPYLQAVPSCPGSNHPDIPQYGRRNPQNSLFLQYILNCLQGVLFHSSSILFYPWHILSLHCSAAMDLKGGKSNGIV